MINLMCYKKEAMVAIAAQSINVTLKLSESTVHVKVIELVEQEQIHCMLF